MDFLLFWKPSPALLILRDHLAICFQKILQRHQKSGFVQHCKQHRSRYSCEMIRGKISRAHPGTLSHGAIESIQNRSFIGVGAFRLLQGCPGLSPVRLITNPPAGQM